MTLKELMERAGSTNQGYSIAYLKDAMREINMMIEDNVVASKANIVKVPSRRGAVTDPRMQKMMERGLEYVSKIDDPEKREAMLERIEKFHQVISDRNIQEIQERMKRYEEYKRSRERKR